MTIEFRGWPKTHRYENETFTITEKIDGTNACVVIKDGEIAAQSRTRLITPEDDNFGFAAWVQENKEELLMLGDGYWFGEWWGRGIQRGYGIDDRRFSLFYIPKSGIVPSCCSTVPIIADKVDFFNLDAMCEYIELEEFGKKGSIAAPGFMKPEGMVVTSNLHRGVRYKIIFD